jgi:hypothetical protein
MTDERTSYVDMLRKFGSDLGLPKVDVDQLIETTGKTSTPSVRVRRWRHKARSRWLREATKLARCYQPLGKLQDNLALQTEFAKRLSRSRSRVRRIVRRPRGNRLGRS